MGDEPDMIFRDEPMRAVRRHWQCGVGECNGEMVSTGEGITALETTKWKHKCDKCGRVDWINNTFPGVVFRALSDKGSKP